jgi:transposase-like protein
MTSFEPPRCPNLECDQHATPAGRFYRRKGWYHPACRLEPVPRFRCKSCGRSFSRQTFRHDYRDRKPQHNVPLFELLTSGVGLRQCGRVLDMNVRAVQEKKQKMAATFARLHGNLCPSLPERRTYLLDEEETYEGASIRPLTMPVVIEKETWFIVATAVGTIRRGAVRGSARRQREEAYERKSGKRKDQSDLRVREVLQTLAAKCPTGFVALRTDQKHSYVRIAKQVFGPRLEHQVTSSKRVRDKANPLFPINVTMAMTRDNCGCLRRQSWLHTKKAERLQDRLLLFTIYRNYVRRRFNRDQEVDTPARFLNLVPRNLLPQEVLAWRQDWGDRSIHPMSPSGATTVRGLVA